MSNSASFRVPLILWTAFLLVVLSLPCCAQSDAGGLRGTVRNEDGKGAAKVSIIVRNVETGYVRTVESDTNGRFDTHTLAPGRYLVQATEGSLKTDEVEALITVGRTNNVDLVLKATVSVEVGRQTQTMAMNAESWINTRDVSNSANVFPRAINAAPIRGRSFPDFVQMTPDIHQESNRNGLIISGQRAVYSYVALDGTDFNDPLQGNQRG